MNLYVIVQRTEIRSNLHHQNQVKYDKRHAMDKDCKNLNSCCKLELENIFISCFNNSSLHYWVTFEKNIFFSHPLVLSERKFLLSRENSTKSTAVSCFLSHETAVDLVLFSRIEEIFFQIVPMDVKKKYFFSNVT